jgi:hypothetical protein
MALIDTEKCSKDFSWMIHELAKKHFPEIPMLVNSSMEVGKVFKIIATPAFLHGHLPFINSAWKDREDHMVTCDVCEHGIFVSSIVWPMEYVAITPFLGPQVGEAILDKNGRFIEAVTEDMPLYYAGNENWIVDDGIPIHFLNAELPVDGRHLVSGRVWIDSRVG